MEGADQEIPAVVRHRGATAELRATVSVGLLQIGQVTKRIRLDPEHLQKKAS